MNEKVMRLVKRVVQEMGEEKGIEALMCPNINTRLYGVNGNIDSLALVVLLSEIEMAVEEDFNRRITIATNRAMSQSRSPFASLELLVDYISKLIDE